MNPVVFMAFSRVRPVCDEQFAGPAVNDLDTSKPRIRNLHKVGSVPGRIGGSVTMQRVTIDSATMEIERQHRALQGLRERPPLQNRHAAVRVAAARLVC